MIKAQKSWVKHRDTPRYKEGDLVWLEGRNLRLSQPTPKLAPRRHGPFKIVQVMSAVNYRLELPTQWSIHPVFHIDLLTPYRETITHGANYQRPPPDLVDNEEEYEVETILDSRLFGRRKRLQYLVKWAGYPDSDNMWVDKDDIFAEDKVREFKHLNPAAKTHIRGSRSEGMSHSPSSTSSYFPPHILSMSSDDAHDLAPEYTAGAYSDSANTRSESPTAAEVLAALRALRLDSAPQSGAQSPEARFNIRFTPASDAGDADGDAFRRNQLLEARLRWEQKNRQQSGAGDAPGGSMAGDDLRPCPQMR